MIVVDTNVIGGLYFPSERLEQVKKALQRDPSWVAPLALAQRVLQCLGLIRPEAVDDAGRGAERMDKSLHLMSGRERDVDSAHVLRLAVEERMFGP